MDDLLPKLLSFPPHPPPAQPLSDQQYDDQIKSQVETLKSISAKTLLRPTSSGENLLDVMNPALNTIPYAFALVANLVALRAKSSGHVDRDDLWEKMVVFLISFDPRQVRYVGHQFSEVIQAVASFARQSRGPAAAVGPIASAILRLDPAGSTLTSSHLILTSLVLESRAYDTALPVIDQHVLYFPGIGGQTAPKLLSSLTLSGHLYITQESGLTAKLAYQHILEYFVHAGAIFIGLRQWGKAQDVLESAVTYPIRDGAVSKIMVEAYKKWILVSVILHGRSPNLPSTTNGVATRCYHSLAKAYEAVGSLFTSASAARLHAEIQTGIDIWENDGNLGLMTCVLRAYQEFQIRRLGDVYRTLSISDITTITTSAGPGETPPSNQVTENLIKDMIERQVLDATFSKSSTSSSVLTFRGDGTAWSESQVKFELSNSLERIKSMTNHVRTTDRHLTHNKDYLRWAQKQRKGTNGGFGTPNAIEDAAWGGGLDEDLMAS